VAVVVKTGCCQATRAIAGLADAEATALGIWVKASDLNKREDISKVKQNGMNEMLKFERQGCAR